MTLKSEGHVEECALIARGTCVSSPAAATATVSSVERPIKESKRLRIQESIRRRFEPWELSLIREGALQEYRLLKNSSETRDLEREEELARDELINDATSLFAALAALNMEAKKDLLDDRAMRLLLERLQKRAAFHQQQYDAHESLLREAGRAEWRREVEEKLRLEQYEEALQKWRRENEESLRAACAFLMGTETRWRRDEVAQENAGWEALCSQEIIDREDAERRAYEAFMNTPEQVALREEQNRKAAKAKKRAERRMKQFLKEQQQLVKSCRHARGQTSFFEGPSARKLCVLCGVRFDEVQGYYVRMRGATIAPPPEMTGALLQSEEGKMALQTPTELPPIQPKQPARARAPSKGLAKPKH